MLKISEFLRRHRHVAIVALCVLTTALCLLFVSRTSSMWRGESTDEVDMPSATGSQIPGLTACGAAPDIFTEDPDDVEATGWDDTFRSTVIGVINADLAAHEVACSQDVRMPATGALSSLAGTLPKWKNIGRTVYESDLPEILLDYLETYGCALKAKVPNLGRQLATRYSKDKETWGKTPLVSQEMDAKKDMEKRLKLATETLQRSLKILIGMNKLRPLEQSFTCIDRASKDLRNVLGLTAEATACLPVRTWDARGILRTASSASSEEPSDEPPSDTAEPPVDTP